MARRWRVLRRGAVSQVYRTGIAAAARHNRSTTLDATLDATFGATRKSPPAPAAHDRVTGGTAPHGRAATAARATPDSVQRRHHGAAVDSDGCVRGRWAVRRQMISLASRSLSRLAELRTPALDVDQVQRTHVVGCDVAPMAPQPEGHAGNRLVVSRWNPARGRVHQHRMAACANRTRGCARRCASKSHRVWPSRRRTSAVRNRYRAPPQNRQPRSAQHPATGFSHRKRCCLPTPFHFRRK